MDSAGGKRAAQPASGRRARGRPTDRRAEETRAAIIAAAQRLFGQFGYDGVSLEALAAECEVNARAIYYHFASKREVFRAATDDAFRRFGEEAVARVFVHDALRDRVAGYVEVYRTLHAADPHVVPFIGMVLVDGLSVGEPGGARPTSPPGTDLGALLETLVDDAFARGEVHPDLDRGGALRLLAAIGMGLSLASLEDAEAFPAMLDALELLIEGTLFAPAAAGANDLRGNRA